MTTLKTLKSLKEFITESRYPMNDSDRKIDADAKEFIDHANKTLKAKGFKKRPVTKQSATEDHTYEHPDGRQFSMYGWHGTGKGSRDYGGGKAILGGHQGGIKSPFKEIAGLDTLKHTEGNTNKGMFKESGVAAHKKTIDTLKNHIAKL